MPHVPHRTQRAAKPNIGFADDIIVLGLVLRSVIKRAGIDTVEAHWPGTPDGLATLRGICRLP